MTNYKLQVFFCVCHMKQWFLKNTDLKNQIIFYFAGRPTLFFWMPCPQIKNLTWFRLMKIMCNINNTCFMNGRNYISNLCHSAYALSFLSVFIMLCYDFYCFIKNRIFKHSISFNIIIVLRYFSKSVKYFTETLDCTLLQCFVEI